MIRRCFVIVMLAAAAGVPAGLGLLWIVLSMYDGASLDGVW